MPDTPDEAATAIQQTGKPEPETRGTLTFDSEPEHDLLVDRVLGMMGQPEPEATPSIYDEIFD